MDTHDQRRHAALAAWDAYRPGLEALMTEITGQDPDDRSLSRNPLVRIIFADGYLAGLRAGEDATVDRQLAALAAWRWRARRYQAALSDLLAGAEQQAQSHADVIARCREALTLDEPTGGDDHDDR
jgi:hypothetical protein